MALDLMERNLSSANDVLAPLTLDELEMEGAGVVRGLEDIGGGMIAFGGAAALVGTAPLWIPITIAAGAGILVDCGIYELTGWW